MSRRDDMRAALERRQPAEAVPVWDIHFHCWDRAAGRPFVVGSEFVKLSSAEQERAIRRDAEAMAIAAAEFRLAAVTIPDAYWEIAPGEPSYYWLPREDRLRLAAALSRLAGDDLLIAAAAGGVMGMPGTSAHYEEFCCRLFDAPDEVEESCRRGLAAGLEGARQLRDAGVEAVYSGADLADNRGPFFSPAHLARFVLPYLRQWAEQVREMGLYALLHTDGNVAPILEDLADSGIQALQAIDPTAGMDIRRVKALVGDRLCLCGNVDPGLLFTGPAEAVYQVTRDLLRDLKPGGGYVLGASNAVFYETPLANYRAMIRAWQDHGRY